MIQRTHLFNPQNDLALANGSANFTAPKSAVDLANAGACLPIWYGNPGDSFLGPVNAGWFKEVSNTFGLNVLPTMQPVAGSLPSPWGWSANAKRRFIDFGYNDSQLPDDNEINLWKQLSSRTAWTSVINDILTALPSLTQDHAEACSGSVESTLDGALQTIARINPAMIKLPWSNAGRGQQVSNRTTDEELPRRIAGMINRQGAVEITPYYERLMDFAMLWDEDGAFVGYSLFDTDTHGGWSGNILISDSEIEHAVCLTAGRTVDFELLRQHLTPVVSAMKADSGYPGPVGIDFIVGRRDKTVCVVPVEVNLRRTMGHVAHRLYSSYIAPGRSANFYIRPTEQVDLPFCRCSDAVIESRQLVSGRLDLVPPGGAFRFILSIQQNN